MVGQLNWASLHTVPEVSLTISVKAFKEGTTQDITKLIKVVRKDKRMGEVTINELKAENVY